MGATVLCHQTQVVSLLRCAPNAPGILPFPASVVNTAAGWHISLGDSGGCDRTRELQFANCIRYVELHITFGRSPRCKKLRAAKLCRAWRHLRGGDPSRTDSGHLDLVQLATLLAKSYNRSFGGRIRPYRGVRRAWKKWLTRRSRASRASFTWARFEQLESRHPLVTPRIRARVSFA